MNKLYVKLASINMKNNRQFYLPYLLTGILSAAMFYSIAAMYHNPGLPELYGGDTIRMFLGFGVYVIGLFVSVFLFYTNSFIIKRRKKELGVYNILGMEKRHIAKVLLLELLFTAITAIGGGLVIGIVFNKLLTMVLYRLTGLAVAVPFYISGKACVATGVLFGFIYLAALVFNLMQIKLANPIQLLRSGSTGEREPKTKLLITVLGALLLGSGYYIAIMVKDPMSAIFLFFAAVILVICGTYCLFTAGSIALLKLLRKNQKFYYKTRHFTAVSGMIYRMKQNAVGLANICILSTMVLVTVSTTVSLYWGIADELKVRYPSEISIDAFYSEYPGNTEDVSNVVTNSLKSSGRIITGQNDCIRLRLYVTPDGNELKMLSSEEYDALTDITLTVLTAAGYEALTGVPAAELSEDEIIMASSVDMNDKTVKLGDREFRIKETYPLPEVETYMVTAGGMAYLAVKDDQALQQMMDYIIEELGKKGDQPSIRYSLQIDIDGTDDEKMQAEAELRNVLVQWQELNTGEGKSCRRVQLETRQESYDIFYAMYGGMFFIGLFLGSMFLMVTVLIIFYKQISEGYEDKERFAIMEKVGMSNEEVKRAIRSQILIVFFLPLVVAAIHVAAAFPMISIILSMLNLVNTGLFIGCLAVTMLVFSIIYLIVFMLTSRSYYKIVGNQV